MGTLTLDGCDCVDSASESADWSLVDAWPAACRVRQWQVQAGAQVHAGDVLAWLEPADVRADAAPGAGAHTPPVRADLQALQQRLALTLDEARPEAVAARHAKGLRTAHENLAASLVGLFDSQIAGGKRYDLATMGRRRSNATYFIVSVFTSGACG